MGIFSEAAKEKKGGGNKGIFSSAAKGEAPDLEQQVKESGASTFLDTAKTAGLGIIDVLSRPNYAVAGAVEELVSPEGAKTPEGVLGRVGKELFSGIGGVQGRKRAFGEVFERAGFGTGLTVSDVAPFLFSETGEGLALKEGGALDITTRGAAGLAGDIFLDPLTYLGGVGLLGKARIPAKAVKVSKFSREILEHAAPEVVETLSRKGTEVLRSQFAEEIGKAATKAEAVAAVKASEGGARGSRLILKDMLETGSPAYRELRDAAQRRAMETVVSLSKSPTGVDLLDAGGIHWMGHTIPGTPYLATLKSGLKASVLEGLSKYEAGKVAVQAVSDFGRGVNALGSLFSPAWAVKGIKGFRESRDTLMSKLASEHTTWDTIVANEAKKYSFSPEQLKKVAKAVDEGTIHALEGAEREAALFIARKNREVLQADWAAGIKVTPRKNYLAHYYENTDSEWAKFVNRFPDKRAGHGDLGRHLEQRVYDTLTEAEIQSAKAGVPLKPLWDPWESLRRRGSKSIEARNWRAWERHLENTWGEGRRAFAADEAFDLSQRGTRKLHPEEYGKVERFLAQTERRTAKDVAGFTDEGKRHFFEERIARAKSPQELTAILNKYDRYQGFFPKSLGFAGEIAEDGSPFVDITLRGLGKARLPQTMAREVASMGESIFNPKSIENQALRGLLAGYDWINNTFKLAVTAWPAFHVRNAYSNVAQSFPDIGLGMLNKSTVRDAVAIQMGRDGVLSTPLGEYTLRELREVFRDRGIMIEGHTILEYTGKNAGKSKFRKGAEKIQRAVGGAIENEARIAHALTLLKRGHTIDEAVTRVNKFLFNYSNLTQAERTFFRRAFPFWTWQSRNLAIQFDNLRRRPGALANQVKPFRGREEENRQMTSWEASALKLRLNGDGKHVEVITGIDLPIRNLDILWRGNSWRTLNGIFGMTSPIIKTPIEYGTGYSFFLNKEFNRKESTLIGRAVEKLPKGVQDFLGFKAEPDAAGRPHYRFDGRRFYVLFQSWALSRVVSTTDRQFREYLQPGNSDVQAAMLDALTGLRDKAIDLTAEQERVAREREKQLKEALERRGEYRRFEKFYRPKEPR